MYEGLYIGLQKKPTDDEEELWNTEVQKRIDSVAEGFWVTAWCAAGLSLIHI